MLPAFSIYEWIHDDIPNVLDNCYTKETSRRFSVNADQTISPCLAQNMVWGMRDSDKEVVLVPRGDKNQLVFEGLPPAFQNRNTMKLAPTNFPGRAVITTYVKNQENGMNSTSVLAEKMM